MVYVPSTHLLATKPRDPLLEAVAMEAEADADRVAALFFAMGYHPTPGKPIFVDRERLLFYGAALRLESWERAGIFVHRDLGLPSAVEIIDDAARALTQQNKWPDGSRLGLQVLQMFHDHFAWSARRDLDAPVVLDSLDEDAALNALAELLWNPRRAEREG
jgi:hypothetical protein